MVLLSCRPVSPPAPGFPNSSGTSVSATDQRIPRLRLHTRRSAQPPAVSQTTSPLFSTWFWLTFTVNFCASARPCVARSGSALTPPLQLTYHGSFLQGSTTIRTSQKSSHILPSPKACRPVINLHSWRQASVVGQSISTFGVIGPTPTIGN